MSDLNLMRAVGALALAVLGAFAALAWRLRKSPLVRWELVRLARAGRQPLLRAAVAGLTLVALLITYLGATSGLDRRAILLGGATVPRERLSNMGETFLWTFLAVELLAVLALAPAVVGAGLGRERDRGTLDLLRTTHLSGYELVAGSYLARVLYVLGVVAAGFPALVASTVLGGIDPVLLLAGMLVILVGAASLGAQSVFASVLIDNPRGALARVYGRLALSTAVGVGCWCIPGVQLVSPATALATVAIVRSSHQLFLAALVCYVVGHLVYVMISLNDSARLVNDEHPFIAPEARLQMPEPVPVYGVEARPRSVPKPGGRGDFGVGEDALRDKEAHFAGRQAVGALTDDNLLGGMFVVGFVGLLVGVSILVLFLGDAAASRRDVSAAEVLNPAARLGAFALAVVVPLLLVGRAAGSVARERDRNTLDALLVLPVERDAILRVKRRAAVGPLRHGVPFVAALLVAFALAGAVHPVAGLAVALHLAAFANFCLSLSMWNSVRAGGAARAALVSLAVVLTIWAAPAVLRPLFEFARGEIDPAGALAAPDAARHFALSLSPPLGAAIGLNALKSTSWAGLADLDRPAALANALAGSAWVVAGWWLWRAARRRFGAQG